jgi:hypothetical protein
MLLVYSFFPSFWIELTPLDESRSPLIVRVDPNLAYAERMLNRRLNSRTYRDIAELARFTTRNSNPELDYDGVGSELAGTAPPSLTQPRNASSSALSSTGLKETSLSERKLGRCWLSWSNPSRITVHRIFRARGCFWWGRDVHYH